MLLDVRYIGRFKSKPFCYHGSLYAETIRAEVFAINQGLELIGIKAEVPVRMSEIIR